MKYIITGTIVACAALIAGGVYLTIQQSNSGRSAPVHGDYTKRVETGGWTTGADNPTVRIIEYGDIQCPACAAYEPILKQALEKTKEYSSLTFRQYPLTDLHDKGLSAAQATEAAGMQGKFWEMHSKLYEQQAQWASLSQAQFSTFVANLASELSIDVEQFKKDMRHKDRLEQIEKDIAAGDVVPVKGTPTLIINDVRVAELPRDVDSLVALIENAR
jgi:protein-disulfide isomerase